MLIADVLRAKGHEVVRIAPEEKVIAAVQRLSERRIGATVVENAWMRVVGIFSERDLLNAVARHGPQVLDATVGEFMSHPVISCHSTDRVDAALALMTMNRIRHLPVLDGEKLEGIVSIGDLVKFRLDEKELEANVLREINRMRV
jgi:CBS domain-containing protein